MRRVDFDLLIGLDFEQQFLFVDDDAIPIDLSGCSALAELQTIGGEVVDAFAVDLPGNGFDGVLRLSMDATDTVDIAPGRYKWGLRNQIPGETSEQVAHGYVIAKTPIPEV